VAEYFSGVVQSGYRHSLHSAYHQQLLNNRENLSYQEYEQFFQFNYVEDGSEQVVPVYRTGNFRLAKMKNHQRIYEKASVDCDVTQSLSFIATKHTHLVNQEDEQFIKINAPGKLILSGEHAVVYGAPALAMAVNRYVTATVSHESTPQVLFDLSDLPHHSYLSFDALSHLKEKIKQKYYRFVRGDYSIRDVLHKPFELAQFAIGVFAESFNFKLPHGVKIKVQSDLPMGCGMGSSAATIVSVMQAISHFMKVSVSSEELFRLALEAENMQHGYSSGLDLKVALYGGCFYMQGQRIEPRSLPSFPLYLVNTGTPAATTGQCVEKTRPLFASNQLVDEFSAVTNSIDAALQQQSWSKMASSVRDNHRLLTTIGVVPDKVGVFISQIEQTGGAAKVCGAGSVMGENAGAVIILSEDHHKVSEITKRFGYQLSPISCEVRGVHAA
jgi:mevalonate kinase